MEIRNISISEDAPEDTVQFVKHLEENLDPNDELACEVIISTVTLGEVSAFPGEDIPTRGDDPEREEFGVRVSASFVENEEAPSRQMSELAQSFYGGGGEYTLNASFDGGNGEYEAYVFPIK